MKSDIVDNRFRKILSETKIPTSDNLKFRIMQQIETEKALSKQKNKSSFSILDNMFSIFGTMYTVIALIAAAVYIWAGKEALESTYTYLTIILIVSVCSMFWMLSLYDEKRRKKNRKNQ